jgi:hypothetical protein
MAIEERGKSVSQFVSHPVEQKIAQQVTKEMKTMEMNYVSYVHAHIRYQKAGRSDGGCGSANDIAVARRVWLFINVKFPAGRKK